MSEALAKSIIADLISDLPERVIIEIMARIDSLEAEALRKQRHEILILASALVDDNACTDSRKVNEALINYYMDLKRKIEEMGARGNE